MHTILAWAIYGHWVRSWVGVTFTTWIIQTHWVESTRIVPTPGETNMPSKGLNSKVRKAIFLPKGGARMERCRSMQAYYSNARGGSLWFTYTTITSRQKGMSWDQLNKQKKYGAQELVKAARIELSPATQGDSTGVCWQGVWAMCPGIARGGEKLVVQCYGGTSFFWWRVGPEYKQTLISLTA